MRRPSRRVSRERLASERVRLANSTNEASKLSSEDIGVSQAGLHS